MWKLVTFSILNFQQICWFGGFFSSYENCEGQRSMCWILVETIFQFGCFMENLFKSVLWKTYIRFRKKKTWILPLHFHADVPKKSTPSRSDQKCWSFFFCKNINWCMTDPSDQSWMLESCRSKNPKLRPQLSDHRILPHAPKGQRRDHTLGRMRVTRWPGADRYFNGVSFEGP